MKFSLIICTYMRPKPLLKLLDSVQEQTRYPDDILIIDGSSDALTQEALSQNSFKNLQYHKVDEENRGLTKQRNIGIDLANEASDFICFLDDDIVLLPNYFEDLLRTYEEHPDALAVGGYIINEIKWELYNGKNKTRDHFMFDDWVRAEPLRYRLRRKFRLLPDEDPGILPSFSHGRALNFLPPSGKTYKVEQIMGGVSSYRKHVFDDIRFSSYFAGYGLYEDTDFSLRLAKLGSLYVNTKAQLYHYHDSSGRPNKYKYGKMVIRNGWYIWRVKNRKPNFKAKFKWNATSLLLTLVRFSNVVNSDKKMEAFTESLGRVVGWFSLLINKPKIG